MMLVTVALLPASWAARLPQKFSAATTFSWPELPAVVPDPQPASVSARTATASPRRQVVMRLEVDTWGVSAVGGEDGDPELIRRRLILSRDHNEIPSHLRGHLVCGLMSTGGRPARVTARVAEEHLTWAACGAAGLLDNPALMRQA